MAYKYKLVTEVDPSAFQKAASAIPSTVNKINVGKRIPGERFGELEAILKEKGLDDDTITDILDTWAERYMFVNPNEGKEKSFMDIASEKAKKGENPDPEDLEQEKINRNKDNTYMTPEERNMTPEERRKHREREDREEREKLKKQGKANLAKEVLNKLKNR
jgi:hypothetical protein